jgi:cobalt-zinc-cadmium resistance protein CzcA
LSALADISLDTGASYIYHERNQRYIPIKFSVRDRDLGSTVAEAQARIASKIKLPEGYRISGRASSSNWNWQRSGWR